TRGGSVVNDLLKLQSKATRRGFLKTTGAATLALASSPSMGGTVAEAAVPLSEQVSLTINGQRYAVDLDPRTTLLDALREHLGVTGSKKGCDQGQCGACTILLDGRRVNSCLLLAVAHQDAAVTTVEGLAANGGLHPVQQGFLDHDGYQC